MAALTRPVTDERDALLSFLAQQRYLLVTTAHGLTDEQAREAPSASPLSVGGLIKHVAGTERSWMDTVQRRERDSNEQGERDYEAQFRLGPDETLAAAIADYARAGAETDAVMAGISDLDQPVPVPDAPWFPKDVEAWTVRWVLLHLITETARHAGHADIVRESVDGATSYPLLAAVEGWPASPWMEPWTPASS